jgi:protease-4
MRIVRVTGFAAFLVFFFFGCTFVEVNMFPRQVPLKEMTLMGKGRDRIVLVEISGFLSTARRIGPLGMTSRPSSVEEVRRVLEVAAKDARVKGLLLRINSPGGTVTASDIIYHEISSYSKKLHWPVVACLMEIATSGAYYLALAAQDIVTHPTTVTGAIGVVALKMDIQGLLRKVGVRVEVYKSGTEKDTWFPFRPSSQEEQRHIQTIIQGFSNRFFSLLKERRSLSLPEWEVAKSGRVFGAPEAQRLHLVDKVGYVEDAFEEVKRLSGIKEARLVAYLPEGTTEANIYSGPPPSPPALLNLLAMGQAAYLWMP